MSLDKIQEIFVNSGVEINDALATGKLTNVKVNDKTSTWRLCLQFSEDGFSVLKNEKWTIFYNDEKQYGRFNNTIVHEIGHIVLNHTEDSELAEKEVKFFAKYALVPPVLVHRLKNR